MLPKWANSVTMLVIFHKLLNSFPKTRIETKQRKWHNEGNSWQILEHDRSGSSGDHGKGSVLSFWGSFISKPINLITMIGNVEKLFQLDVVQGR